jgi:hypothetical protein
VGARGFLILAAVFVLLVWAASGAALIGRASARGDVAACQRTPIELTDASRIAIRLSVPVSVVSQPATRRPPRPPGAGSRGHR